MTKKIDQEIYNLVLKGKISCKDEPEEDAAIELLKKSADKEPDLLWAAIFEAFTYEITGMALPAMAAYLCCPKTKSNFNYKVKSYFVDLLLTLNPVSLLELTEYVQSKVFGGGLGSRNQKLLSSVLEKWKLETFKEYGEIYPSEMLALVKILHPKFQGEKGKIIRTLTNKNA